MNIYSLLDRAGNILAVLSAQNKREAKLEADKWLKNFKYHKIIKYQEIPRTGPKGAEW